MKLIDERLEQKKCLCHLLINNATSRPLAVSNSGAFKVESLLNGTIVGEAKDAREWGGDERRSGLLVAESIETSSKIPIPRGKVAFSGPMAMEKVYSAN